MRDFYVLSTKLFLGPRAKIAVNIHINNIQDQKIACQKRKNSISCRPYIQGLLQKIKIYVQMLSLIFLVSYLLLELEFPKNIEERKVLPIRSSFLRLGIESEPKIK